MLLLFRFFAIIFLIILGISFVSRFIMRQFVRKMGGMSNNQTQNKTRREGEVHVKTNQQKEKIVDKDIGEYIDYEEVD